MTRTRVRKYLGIPETNRHDEKWNEMLLKLLAYKAKHHSCMVPQQYEKDTKLGRWVHYQRVEYWQFLQEGCGKISQCRIDKLESIGFEWDPQRCKWNTMFRRLVDFRSKYGHCNVPKDYAKDLELSYWLRNQRFEYANRVNKGKSRLTDERLECLKHIGLEFRLRPSKEGEFILDDE